MKYSFGLLIALVIGVILLPAADSKAADTLIQKDTVWSGAHGGPIYFVRFTNEGKHLVTASQDGLFRIWDVATSQEVRKFGGEAGVACVALSPDGKVLAAASQDGLVRLYDVGEGKETKSFHVGEKRFYFMAFAPDGQSLATAGPDRLVLRLWDLDSGKVIRKFGTPPDPRRAVDSEGDVGNFLAFSGDGKQLAWACSEFALKKDGTVIKVFEVETGKELRSIKGIKGRAHRVGSIAFAPNGKILAWAALDGAIRLINSDDGKEFDADKPGRFILRFNTLVFSPDSKMLASRTGIGTGISLWEVESGKAVRKLGERPLPPPDSRHFNQGPLNIAFSPDGKTVAEGLETGAVRLYEVESGKEIRPQEAKESAKPADPLIQKDTTWSGQVVVKEEVRVRKAKLTIEPGARIEFQEGGRIKLEGGAALLARGTADKPVRFVGDSTGAIIGHNCAITLEHCRFEGLGTEKEPFLNVTPGADGVTFRSCTLTDCAGIAVHLQGPFEMTGCDVRRPRRKLSGHASGFNVHGKGTKVTIADNTIENMTTSGYHADAEILIRGNVVVSGGFSGWGTKADKMVFESNYIHWPVQKGTFGLSAMRGVIRNNVIRGAGWTTGGLGGDISGNLIMSLPHEEAMKLPGGFDKNCTHEHIVGLLPKSTLTRNIFVGASYGAVMGIGHNTGSEAVIRNNTFDMRGHGNPVYLNHLTQGEVKGVVIRNNLMLRCGAILNEDKKRENSVAYTDYNLWAAAGRKGRFPNITIDGKKPGDIGFGKNDVPPLGDKKELKPDEVVVNPNIEFPYSDEDMLARKKTPAEVLKAYRAAYKLKAGSPALDAGDPADKNDPAVTDGKPDIGAIEHAPTGQPKKSDTNSGKMPLASPDETILAEASLAKAAESLDRVAVAWVRRHQCGSCHTSWPYLMARPVLKDKLTPAHAEVRKFFEERVAKWDEEVKTSKHAKREVVGHATALAMNDALTTGKLHPLTRQALDRIWTFQRKDGGFDWPKCEWPPFEMDDYYGALLVAVGVGYAPEGYAKGDSAKAGMEKLRGYFKATPPPSLHHKAWLLWAAARLDGLMSDADRQAAIKEPRALQRRDGGWAMEALGKDWVGRRGAKSDPDAPSDGYGTALVVFVLREAGVTAGDEAVQRGAQWLRGNQRESGRWFVRSLNDVKQHFISDTATAFAVLALKAVE